MNKISMKDIPNYVGSFKVKKSLTKAMNYWNHGLWVIFRDPDNGLYAYNEDLDEEVNLMTWNASLEDVLDKNSNLLRYWMSDIEEYIKTLHLDEED